MQKLTSHQSIEHKNSENCVVSEFPTDDQQINFATAKITARYPETGLASNTLCREIVYVQEGAGKIVVDNVEYSLAKGDVILVLPNEKFYWEGNMTIHIACTPAFTPEQHIHIEA